MFLAGLLGVLIGAPASSLAQSRAEPAQAATSPQADGDATTAVPSSGGSGDASSPGAPPVSVAPGEDQEAGSGDAPSTTVFSHPESGRFWLTGQMNFILQAHPSFPAKYSGPNSLRNVAERDVSSLMTLYTGVELSKNTEFIFDVESAGGRGLSDALGIAGFTDLDVVRSPDLGWSPYVARWIIRQVVPLGGGSVQSERSFLSLASTLPARRIEILAGKFSLVDFFDLNSVGSDSHLQFMNWSVDNNGAYDYAANTRGYTDGVIVEYDDRRWAARFAEALMPKTPNGIHLDADVARAHAENLEFEFHPTLLAHRSTVVRVLSYLNHANMGSYRQAIHAFEAGLRPVPDVDAHPRQTRVKYGFGVNVEQELPGSVRLFGRWGWNDGRTESFAYTEIDRTVAFGGDVRGDRRRRRQDRFGAAFVVNAISGDHRDYLALGGRGFMLGDGALDYGTERIFEAYYTAHLWRGVFGSADLQHITNPGYNRDRGPVFVPSLRLHVDY